MTKPTIGSYNLRLVPKKMALKVLSPNKAQNKSRQLGINSLPPTTRSMKHISKGKHRMAHINPSPDKGLIKANNVMNMTANANSNSDLVNFQSKEKLLKDTHK